MRGVLLVKLGGEGGEGAELQVTANGSGAHSGASTLDLVQQASICTK